MPSHALLPLLLVAMTLTATVGRTEERTMRQPGLDERRQACELVAEASSQKRMTDYLVRDGVFDVDNDGMADRVVSGKRIGTRHGDMFTLTDPLGRAHEYAVDQDDPWRWTLGAGWLPFRGFFYAVHFHGEDGSFPSHMTLHTPMGSEVICAFRSSVTEHASALSPADQPLCRRVVDQGIDDAAIGPSTPRSSDRRETDTNLPRRRETHAQAEYVVDFDNDGVDERLVLLAFERPAETEGAPC